MKRKPLKPKTRTELANDYGIDRKTLARRLRDLNILTNGRILTIRQVKRVYEAYGYPEDEQKVKFSLKNLLCSLQTHVVCELNA